MIKEIYLYQFRNLATMCLALDAKHIILKGDNGAGKSNFLEAVYYSCLGSSFRERHDEHIAHFDKNEFATKAIHRIDTHFDTINIQYRAKNKQIFLNQAVLRDRKELLLRYPCVMFGYHDTALVHGEPSLRRQFFDQVASLVYADAYILLLRSYQQLVKQRSKAFKLSQLAFIDSSQGMFVQLNAQLGQLRQTMMAQFNQQFQVISQKLLGNAYHFSYKASLKGANEQELGHYLQDKQAEEWLRRSSLYGVHRDRYLLMQGDKEVSSYLSVGQKRMISLLMKQVLAQLITQLGQRKPIILLDDVFVELSQSHKEKFWQLLPEYEQLFMTQFTEELKDEGLQSCKIYAVEQGEIYLQEES
jgi:DNA replication and repair protein RecF